MCLKGSPFLSMRTIIWSFVNPLYLLIHISFAKFFSWFAVFLLGKSSNKGNTWSISSKAAVLLAWNNWFEKFCKVQTIVSFMKCSSNLKLTTLLKETPSCIFSCEFGELSPSKNNFGHRWTIDWSSYFLRISILPMITQWKAKKDKEKYMLKNSKAER